MVVRAETSRILRARSDVQLGLAGICANPNLRSTLGNGSRSRVSAIAFRMFYFHAHVSSPAQGRAGSLLRMCKALPKTGTLELGLDTTPPASVISTKPEEVREADDGGRVDRSRESCSSMSIQVILPEAFRVGRTPGCDMGRTQRRDLSTRFQSLRSFSLAQGDRVDLPLLSRSFFVKAKSFFICRRRTASSSRMHKPSEKKEMFGAKWEIYCTRCRPPHCP
jgi:hypothetical protein